MRASIRCGAAAAVLALAAGCVSDDRREPPSVPASPVVPARPPFVIENLASHAIAEIHIAPVAERSWEPNLLEVPLPPGSRAAAEKPACSHYDVLVVKEDGTRCILANTAMCFESERWTIHDVTLESCLWRL